ncbi:GspH/FimT family pseudopilin [Quatrionicoccus australiensis]|uniref:GspH/FimT family pseudopilin n=1 Tax=Quatrionicoccus australiensis TaxID=138118 RepID=UPI001CF909DC|nr:GspH/FimT family pseudopilin [Quatrionicoccus australiensis]UCV16318.1 GspH/FimT family pseudopilin [Quatrionicoccus australiensis]
MPLFVGYRRFEGAGFSLIEVMVVLVIAIVLTLVAVPGMTNLFRDARLSTQTDMLISTLNSARLEAVKQRKNITVCPMTNADTGTACSASASDWTNGFGVWDGTAIIQRVAAKGDAAITTAATSVVFVGTFGSTSAAASFTLCASGRKQQQIDIGVSGHVSKKINSTLCS